MKQTNKKEEWIEEFEKLTFRDDRFSELTKEDLLKYIEKLKQFIKTFRKSDEKKLLEMIEKEIAEPIPELEGRDSEDCRIFNKALETIKEKVKEIYG